MKEKLLRIVLIIGIIFVVNKIYQLFIINKMYEQVKKFIGQENRYYSIEMCINRNITHKEKIYVKSDIVKYIKQRAGEDEYYEWKDFYTGNKYGVDVLKKSYFTDDIAIENKEFFSNLPQLIRKYLGNGKVDILQMIKIRYIIPIKYNDVWCLKIVTENEIVIIDATTFLPKYSSLNTINSSTSDGHKIENSYEFKIGEVTEEDIKMPDLTGYIHIVKK